MTLERDSLWMTLYMNTSLNKYPISIFVHLQINYKLWNRSSCSDIIWNAYMEKGRLKANEVISIKENAQDIGSFEV